MYINITINNIYIYIYIYTHIHNIYAMLEDLTQERDALLAAKGKAELVLINETYSKHTSTITVMIVNSSYYS